MQATVTGGGGGMILVTVVVTGWGGGGGGGGGMTEVRVVSTVTVRTVSVIWKVVCVMVVVTKRGVSNSWGPSC